MPSTINYVARLPAWTLPAGEQGTPEPWSRTITFLYTTTRPDPLQGPQVLSQLLKAIRIHAQDAALAPHDVCVWLRYETSIASRRSLLKTVEFGKDICSGAQSAAPTATAPFIVDDRSSFEYAQAGGVQHQPVHAIHNGWADWGQEPLRDHPDWDFEHAFFHANNTPASFATGDFNGDGFKDLLRVRNNYGCFANFLGVPTCPEPTMARIKYLSVMMGSAGGLQPEVTIELGSRPSDFVSEADVGDIDGDGFDDVFLHSTSGGYEVLFGAAGGLQPTSITGSVTPAPGGAFFYPGDFNGDRRRDFAYVDFKGGTAQVLSGFARGPGSGTFAPPSAMAWVPRMQTQYCPSQLLAPNAGADCFVWSNLGGVADIDDDGFDDVFHFEVPNLYYFGPDVLGPNVILTVLSGQADAQTLSFDLRGQGGLPGVSDVAFDRAFGISHQHGQRTGAHFAAPPVMVGTGSSRQFDSRLDQTVRSITWDGSAFDLRREHFVETSPLDVGDGLIGFTSHIVDTNGDGVADIVTDHRVHTKFFVDRIAGTSDGRFGGPTATEIASRLVSQTGVDQGDVTWSYLTNDDKYFGWKSASGDLNGDGLADIVFASFDVEASPIRLRVEYLLGRADGLLGVSAGSASVLPGIIAKPPLHWELIVQDFNGDGVSDILIANASANAAAITTPGSEVFADGSFLSLSIPTHNDRLTGAVNPGGGRTDIEYSTMARASSCVPGWAPIPAQMVAPLTSVVPAREPTVSAAIASNDGASAWLRPQGHERVVCSVANTDGRGSCDIKHYHFDAYVAEMSLGSSALKVAVGPSRAWTFDAVSRVVTVTDYRRDRPSSALYYGGLAQMPTHVQVFAPPGQWSAAYPGKFWEAREATIDYVTRWVPAVEALPAVETRRELMDFAGGGATIKQTTITRDFDAYGFARSVTSSTIPPSPPFGAAATRGATSSSVARGPWRRSGKSVCASARRAARWTR